MSERVCRIFLMLCLACSSSTRAGETIELFPSGLDDTTALQDAFERASKLGPDVKVRMAEGIYHVTRPIIVQGFQGKWTGAGKHRTIIEVQGAVDRPCDDLLRAVPAVSHGCFPFAEMELDLENGAARTVTVSSAFLFLGTIDRPVRLAMARLKIVVNGVSDPFFFYSSESDLRPPEAPSNIIPSAIQLSGPNFGIFSEEVHNVYLKLNRVAIKGQARVGALFQGSIWPQNLMSGVVIAGSSEFLVNADNAVKIGRRGPVRAQTIVTRSNLVRVFRGLEFRNLLESTGTVGGSPEEGNRFVTSQGAAVIELSDSHLVFAGNVGATDNVLFLQTGEESQSGIAKPGISHVEIVNNELRLRLSRESSPSGVYIDDAQFAVTGERGLSARVQGNTFRSQSDSALGQPISGITIFSGQGIEILNNTITGLFETGGITTGFCTSNRLCLEPDKAVEGLRIEANKLDITSAGNGFRAPVWLSAHTHNCVVAQAESEVLDEGVSNKLE